MKKVLAIIPARYGSTRLEGKPLIDLCGKTMIQRVYEQTKKAIDNVVVATDDQRIYDEVVRFGGKVQMTSSEHTTGTNRCIEVLEKLQKTGEKYDIVLNIQGDEPLLEPVQVTKLISCFEDKETTMATLVIPTQKAEELTSGVFVTITKDNYALYFSRSVIPFIRDDKKEDWHKENIFYKHVGMYGFTAEALLAFGKMPPTTLENSEKLEQLRWLENGHKIKIAKTQHNSIPVDTLEDVEKVIEIIRNKSQN